MKMSVAARSKTFDYKAWCIVVIFLLIFMYYRIDHADYDDVKDRTQLSSHSTLQVVDDVVIKEKTNVQIEDDDEVQNLIHTITKEEEEVEDKHVEEKSSVDTNTKEDGRDNDEGEDETRESSQENDSLVVEKSDTKEELDDEEKNLNDNNTEEGKEEDDKKEEEEKSGKDIFFKREGGGGGLRSSSNGDRSDEHGTIVIGDDPKCRLGFPISKPGERKNPDKTSLGPCVYVNTPRVEPEGTWLKDIDWFFNRKITDDRRQECFLKCVQEYLEVTPNLLTSAAALGLTNLTQYLMEEHQLDPLYNVTEEPENANMMDNPENSRLVPNPLQAGIMSGNAQVVKLLSRDNPSMVVDNQGRTVRDYVLMKGSPIRPKNARDILGITADEKIAETSKLRTRRRRATSYKDPWKVKHGWNESTVDPVSEDDNEMCDIDIVYELSPEDFIQNYYLPGRPVLIRNHVSWKELQSFSKEEWSTLEYFHPTHTEFKVGPTAYPSLTNQSSCSEFMTLEDIEKDARCPDFPELHMVHAEHDQHFHEVFRIFDEKNEEKEDEEEEERLFRVLYEDEEEEEEEEEEDIDYTHTYEFKEVEEEDERSFRNLYEDEEDEEEANNEHPLHRHLRAAKKGTRNGHIRKPKRNKNRPFKGSFNVVPKWFLVEEQNAWQIFFGGDGSGATLHWHSAAVNMLYVGTKEWQLTPPWYRAFTGMPAQAVKETLRDNPNVLRCTQRAGDLIYIPDYWGHMTINRGFGIGVAALINKGLRNLPGAEMGYYVRKEQKSEEQVEAEVGSSSTGASKTETAEPEELSSTDASTDTVQQEDQNIFFVHINKAGGSSMIEMLRKRCSSHYITKRWFDENDVSHRTFHLTAHAHRDYFGIEQWNASTTFALVRHPLARQVSNFFFLIDMCERVNCKKNKNERLIPIDGSFSWDSTEEEKIQAFHDWMQTLYETYHSETDTSKHYLLGSKGHGNEAYDTFNATQTSWLVDETGQHIVVDHVWKLESISHDLLQQQMPCLEGEVIHSNKSPSYPHYTKFAFNDNTNAIMREIFEVDYRNFGYELP